jgi:hypothetical protein
MVGPGRRSYFLEAADSSSDTLRAGGHLARGGDQMCVAGDQGEVLARSYTRTLARGKV